MLEEWTPEDYLTPDEMDALYADAEARHERNGDRASLDTVVAITTWRHERDVNARLRTAAQAAVDAFSEVFTSDTLTVPVARSNILGSMQELARVLREVDQG